MAQDHHRCDCPDGLTGAVCENGKMRIHSSGNVVCCHVMLPKVMDQSLFLLSVALDGKDGHGFNLEKVGPTFSTFNSLPQKSPKLLQLVLFHENNVLDIFFISLQGHFCMGKLAYKTRSKFFSSAKCELEIRYVYGGKARAYYRNRKREAKDFEKVQCMS